MANRYLHYPFRLGSQGGVAVTDDPDRHLRDRIEAVLFTQPGERVNRPEFGAGLNRALFEGLNEVTLTALEFRVTDALQRELGEELLLDDVTLDPTEEAGEVTLRISFRRRVDQAPRNLEIRL
jgi:hypothetical protein